MGQIRKKVVVYTCVVPRTTVDYLLQRYNGAFAFLGVAPPGTEGKAAPCHSNHMLVDEDAMAVGVAMHAAIALTYLDGSD